MNEDQYPQLFLFLNNVKDKIKNVAFSYKKDKISCSLSQK